MSDNVGQPQPASLARTPSPSPTTAAGSRPYAPSKVCRQHGHAARTPTLGLKSTNNKRGHSAEL